VLGLPQQQTAPRLVPQHHEVPRHHNNVGSVTSTPKFVLHCQRFPGYGFLFFPVDDVLSDIVIVSGFVSSRLSCKMKSGCLPDVWFSECFVVADEYVSVSAADAADTAAYHQIDDNFGITRLV